MVDLKIKRHNKLSIKKETIKRESIASQFIMKQELKLQINDFIKTQEVHEASPYKESIKLTYTPIATIDYLSKAEFIIENSHAC